MQTVLESVKAPPQTSVLRHVSFRLYPFLHQNLHRGHQLLPQMEPGCLQTPTSQGRQVQSNTHGCTNVIRTMSSMEWTACNALQGSGYLVCDVQPRMHLAEECLGTP